MPPDTAGSTERRSAPATAASETYPHVVLAPGEWLVIRPKHRLTARAMADLQIRLPDELRDRVLFVDATFDVLHVRPIA